MNHINGVMIRVLGLSEEDCGSNKLIFVASPLSTQHQGVKAKTKMAQNQNVYPHTIVSVI